MQNTTDILEGLHVLLVSEDEQRTQALGKVLRERRAHVGNLKISSRDPIALRGADVLVIDTRSAQNTQSRVSEMRADVRARWASVINLDFAKVVPDAGALQFPLLENAVAPVTAADRALTERARKEQSFTTELLPLGPTRVLRALGMAGTTLQVEFAASSGSRASLTLSNELLVSCFMDRNGTRWEAWKALARVLGLSDASVKVSRLQHPSAMNIMEPLDQALQTAAQERHASAAEIAREEPSAAAPPAVPEESKPANPFKTPGTAPGAVAALASKDFKVQPGRTIMGIAPGIPKPPAPANSPAVPVSMPPATPAALPNVASAFGSRPEPPAAAKPLTSAPSIPSRPMGGPELGKPGRTMMGIAPGALPALGAFGVRKPEPAPMETADTPANAPVPSPPAVPGASKPEVSGVAQVEKPALLDNLALSIPDNSQDRELLPTMPAPAPSEAELHFNELGESRVERIARVSLGDTPTDPAPPRGSEPHDEFELEGDGDREETTAVTGGDKIDRLREEAARLHESTANLPSTGSTLGEDFDGFVADVREPLPTKPFDASALARAAEPLDGKKDEGSQPLNFSRDESQEETMTMERPHAPPRRKGRTIAVAILLALAAGEVGYLVWSRSKVADTAPATDQPQANSAHAEAPPAEAQPTAAPAALAPTSPEPAPSAPPSAAPEAQPSAAAVAAPEAQPSVAPSAAATGATEAKAPVQPSAPVAEEPASPAVPTGADADALEALIKDGTRLLAEKNPKMAKPLFEAALSRDPKNPHAQAGLGQALLETGDAAQAQVAFETAIKLRPKRARYRVQLGDALKAQGKLEEARAAWEKALEVDPADREAPKRLGK